MTVAILGAGAFGTALAIALGREGDVLLWGRSTFGRESTRLPGIALPEAVLVTDDMRRIDAAETVLLALPTQVLRPFLEQNSDQLKGHRLVACCKGVDLVTGLGPCGVIANSGADLPPSILTGPSFAADLALGLPTALTLACADDAQGRALQEQLSTGSLRVYRTTDVVGAEFGGALKNVIAIAAGVVIGAGLGDSARAALMTRGYAEMVRFATARGARAETLAGLSGFGDLVLTSMSEQSRNFRFGRALGAGLAFDQTVTVEGVATAKAVSVIAETLTIDMPVTAMVAALIDGRIALPDAIQALLSRPLKQE